jgi:alanine dehydrogenase
MPTTDDDQLTVVFDDETGRVRGVVTGPFLGAARTGAIGAVAVDALANPDADSLGLIGTGRQAYAQLWAIRAVRDLLDVRVFGRDAQRREEFVRRARAELALPIAGVAGPREAVQDADARWGWPEPRWR